MIGAASFSTKVQEVDFIVIQKDGSRGFVYLKRYNVDCKIYAKWHSDYVELLIKSIELTVTPSSLIGGNAFGYVSFIKSNSPNTLGDDFMFSASHLSIDSISGGYERIRLYGVKRSYELPSDDISSFAS